MKRTTIHSALFVSAGLLFGCTIGAGVMPDGGRAIPLDGNGGTPECVSAGATLGAACETGAECNDGCFCNGTESCVEGVCEAGADPCEDGIECTHHVCDEAGSTCVQERDDSVCDDHEPCNGAELCAIGFGCLPGARLDCNDDDACTFDGCEPGSGCVHGALDLDGDGHPPVRCGGDDCDDVRADVQPGEGEVCGNLVDDDCDGLADALDFACRTNPTPCETSDVVSASASGTYTVHTQRYPAGQRMSYGCVVGINGALAVLHLTLAAPSDVSVSATGAGGVRADSLGVVFREWASCASGPDDGCFPARTTAPVSYTRRALPAGEYAVILPYWQDTLLDLDVTVEITPATANIDVCDATTKVIAPGVAETGVLGELGFDHTSYCTTGLAGTSSSTILHDAAYRFDLTERSRVRATATMTGGVAQPAWVAITSDCDDPYTTASCSRTGGATPWRALDPGTYFVLVAHDSDGTFEVTLEVEPDAAPEGDACADPAPVPTESATLSYSDYGDDALVPCAPLYDRSDAVYQLDLTEESDVRVTALTGFRRAEVALQTGCGTAASTAYCGTLPNFDNLAAGTYYLAVSLAAGDTNFSVAVTPSPPRVPGDSCDSVASLSNGESVRVDLRTTSPIRDDYDVCGSTTGRDVVYRVHVATRSRLIAATSATTPPTALDLARSCDPTDTIVCDSSGLLSQVLDPGDYFLFVDGVREVDLNLFLSPM